MSAQGAGLAKLLERAAARRAPPPETTAYRLVNAEADGLPGITVDWFEAVAVLALYREASGSEEASLGDALMALGARSVYLKRRPREARVLAGTRREQLAPEAPLRGETVPELTVLELGLRFLIRPGQGLSVGLYLDSREVRRWVRAHSAGQQVLNCFAYTCGFGIAALFGGAARAVNVDVSRKVLDWGMANARLNGFLPERADFIAGDAFDQLARLARRGERFDQVVLDPPSFATTRKSRFSAGADYPRLAAAAARVVRPGGQLIACCNLASLPQAKLEAMVSRGLAEVGRAGRVTARLSAPANDFPPAPGTGPSLKGAAWMVD